MRTDHHYPDLIKDLLALQEPRKGAVLAALRTGVGKAPGEAPRMLPFMALYLSSADPTNSNVLALFTVASLYAKNPSFAESVSLGRALWNSVAPRGKHGQAGVESRLVAAIDADPEDLPRHLDGLISLCASANVGLDWFKLRWDIYHLLDKDEQRRDRVRLSLARDFWQGDQADQIETDTQGNSNDSKNR
jgi:CRISPR type I-E-associated protein CasB/Cse2